VKANSRSARLQSPASLAHAEAALSYMHLSIDLYLGRSGPNLKPGTVCVCGLRNGMNTTQRPPSPASRAGTDPPTNVQAVSRAVRYVNTHRPRFQIRARSSYLSIYVYIYSPATRVTLRAWRAWRMPRPPYRICMPV